MSAILREIDRIDYFNAAGPRFDDYVYCDGCSDFVFEICYVHPLLVIPDNKVCSKRKYPSSVERAALTIPRTFLHLGPSFMPGAALGVFTKVLLPRGLRFGPYIGVQRHEVHSEYCWEIFDRNRKRAYVVDASDVSKSNWLRYVNWARHGNEQNLLAYQYQGEIYYRTIKVILPFTELRVYYGSEYAHTLQIDLRKYYEGQYYDEMLRRNTVFAKNNVKTNTDCEPKNTAMEEIGEMQNSNNLSAIDNINSDVTYVTAMNYEENVTFKLDSTENNENVFTYEKCQISFANSKNVKSHLARSRTGIGRFDCDQCDFKTNTEYNLRKHLLNHNKPKKYICHKCQFKTNDEWRFSSHRPCHITGQTSKETGSYYFPSKCSIL